MNDCNNSKLKKKYLKYYCPYENKMRNKITWCLSKKKKSVIIGWGFTDLIQIILSVMNAILNREVILFRFN